MTNHLQCLQRKKVLAVPPPRDLENINFLETRLNYNSFWKALGQILEKVCKIEAFPIVPLGLGLKHGVPQTCVVSLWFPFQTTPKHTSKQGTPSYHYPKA